ncbi:dehydrogenase [Micrococcales bacterium 31B]|nr:dehydrogenase [Micrococcales bacterium 31B]
MTRDFLREDGSPVWGDIGLGALDAAGIDWEYLSEDAPVLRPQHTRGFDGILLGSPAVDAQTFGAGANPRIFARFGVGYDAIDLDACAAHGALVTITPDGARRAVATAALTLLLAVKMRLLVKSDLVRARTWAPRVDALGDGLTGNTVGLVGFGNIAGELVHLLRPFDCEVLAGAPWCRPERAAAHGVRVVPRDEFLERCDAFVIVAPLTDATRHAVDDDFLGRVKPTSIVVNVARGAIVDESALYRALTEGRLAGAGLDVFEQEPSDSPLIDLPNVTATPHSLAWTSEMSRGNGASALGALIDVAAGRRPRHVVTPPR